MVTQSQLQAAITLYNSGASGTKVTKFLGLTYPKLAYDLLRENGVTIRSRGRPKADGTFANRKPCTPAQMAEKFKSGMTLRDIADELNTSHQNISHTMIRHGFNPKTLREEHRLNRTYKPNARQKAMADMYALGVQPKLIAEQFGVNVSTVTNNARKQGKAIFPAGYWARSDRYEFINNEVVKRYLRGDKIDDIAEALNLPKGTAVYPILRRQGYKPIRMPTAGRWAYTRQAA